MITGTSLLKNGRVTGPLPSVKDLVKNKIVHAITASRYWSSSEYSQNNSWNVNFSNAVSYLEEACKNCDKEAIYANVRSINSYLGFLIHYQSYGIRRKAFSELHYFWKACYIQGKFQVVKIKNTVQCL